MCLFAALIAPRSVLAQNPLFWNPALDSNCYFPQVGVSGEIDTVSGSAVAQDMGGSIIKNLGNSRNGEFSSILIENLTPTLSAGQVITGPGLDLHHLKIKPQNLDLSRWSGSHTLFHTGHFRDRQHLDLFIDRAIYWADDEGNYDTARKTKLQPKIPEGNGGWGWGTIEPYIAYLTSDTVEDIVLSAFSYYSDDRDTAYALLYKGGPQLALIPVAYQDTSALLFAMTGKTFLRHKCTQADFRGTGREDLIVTDDGYNLTYFKNDPPFSIEGFAKAVAMDTIFAGWQNPSLDTRLVPPEVWFTMPAMPKKRGDRSVDFLPVFEVIKSASEFYNNICIYAGGPNFGSKRLTVESADYVIHSPAQLGLPSNYDWPYDLQDAGDMTGSGNHVMYALANFSIHSWVNNFYVTGTALDEKIDVFSRFGSWGDTLTADNDSLQDLLLKDPTGNGYLALYHGSIKIPVRLNPLWAGVYQRQLVDNQLLISPNPASSSTTLTLDWPIAEEAMYFLYDLLGDVQESGTISLYAAAQSHRLSLRDLTPGVYTLEVRGRSKTLRSRVTIVR